MIIQSDSESEMLRHGGRALAVILAELAKEVRPGVRASDLDQRAEEMIRNVGGVPSFKGYRGGKRAAKPYPATLCVSVNDELVHALPSPQKIFKEGDVIGIDIGMRWPYPARARSGKAAGLFTDMAVTLALGPVSGDVQRLLQGTREALDAGIARIRAGVRVGDVGARIQEHLEKYKLGIVRNLAGHGVGRAVHEEPLVPNFGTPGNGPEIVEGMVLAIEPMATLGDGKTELAPDGWAYVTCDRSIAAHFEHTVVVTRDGTLVLTRV